VPILARDRTLPLFAGEPPPRPKRLSRRTLRRRICDAAIALYLDKPGASVERVLQLCRDLLTMPD